MKRAGSSLLLLALLAVALTLWIGPRPVYELWVAEELASTRLRELFPGCPDAPPAPPGSPRRVRELAALNDVPETALPPLEAGAQLFDADNDGDLDLFVPAPAAGSAGEGDPARGPRRFALYQNDGTAQFRDISPKLGDAFLDPRSPRAASEEITTRCLDLDRDGLLDILVSLPDGSLLALRNRFAERHYLRVRPVSSRAPQAGSKATARVMVTAGGKRQVRLVELRPDASPDCRVTAHFGLGSHQRADAVTVEWPSGIRTEVHDVPAGGEEVLLEPQTHETERKES